MDLADKLRRHAGAKEGNLSSPVQGPESILKQLERMSSILEKYRSAPVLPSAAKGAEDFGGEVRSNTAGQFLYFCNKVTCPCAQEISAPFGSSGAAALLVEILQGKQCDFDSNRILYLDTETTGLSGGAGTYAFLAGIGYWERQKFLIEQYFMRDYDEEKAMLEALGDRLSQAQLVVTFNGKTFDLPLLESRFVLSRSRWPLRPGVHMDLLYPARRLWRLRLRDCSLGVLEKEILGVTREKDVPGHLIPRLYFNYARTRVPSGIQEILEHNRQDIAALAALTQRVSCVLTGSEETAALPGEDLLSAGKYFRDLGKQQMAQDYNRAALDKELPPELKLQAMERLAALYKLEGLHALAVSLWESVAANCSTPREETWEHLAVHYEHRERNLLRALELTDQIVRKLASENEPFSRVRKWTHRQQRLLKKTQYAVREAAPIVESGNDESNELALGSQSK